jgi:ureidoglycolate hydrolase
LTPKAFAPFGTFAAMPARVPDWAASGSRIDGVCEGSLRVGKPVANLWKLTDLIFRNDTPYIGFVKYFHQGFRLAQLERHGNETQTWFARKGVSFFVVAPPTVAGEMPTPESAQAFLIEPGELISIGVGVWMCHFFPIFDEAEYLVITARREPEQDRDLVNLVVTSNTVLELVLS